MSANHEDGRGRALAPGHGTLAEAHATRTTFEPPVSTRELLGELAPRRVLRLEERYGNGDLLRVLDALGIAGPLRRLSPWELEDPSGRHLVHAGGYAALPFGEGNPELIAFVGQVLGSLRTQSFPQQAASPWRAALEANLVELLASHAPSHRDSRALFSNSGAEAMELALKLVKAARPKARWILTFEGAYHGKTLGALSVTPNEEFQARFRPLLPGVKALPYGDAEALEREILALGANDVVAVVLEPVQGEAGVRAPTAGFLARVEALRRRHGIPVVADEIQTGLGRSGHWFASVAAGLDPDVIALGKQLSGGLVPVAATLARRRLVDGMLNGFSARRHSSTYAGNTLSMAVALKSLEMMAERDLVGRSARLGGETLQRLRSIQERHGGYVREVRGSGMLLALRLRHVVRPGLVPGGREMMRLFATGLGVRALHLGGVHACFSLGANSLIRLTPPLDVPEGILEQLLDRVEAVAARHGRAWTMLPKLPPTRLLRLARLAARGGPR